MDKQTEESFKAYDKCHQDDPITCNLYHYTTLDAALSILAARSLWLTNFKYLNDDEEILHGNNIVENLLEDRYRKNNIPIEKRMIFRKNV